MQQDKDFETYLQVQEERIAKLKEASLVAHGHRSADDASGESCYTTTPLSKFNDRMVEYERPRTTSRYLSRLNSRKLFCMLALFLIAAFMIVYVLQRSHEESK